MRKYPLPPKKEEYKFKTVIHDNINLFDQEINKLINSNYKILKLFENGTFFTCFLMKTTIKRKDKE